MTTGQNNSAPKPNPGKKSSVLPQVRYHPSIQNATDSGGNRAKKMEKTQKKDGPKGTGSRAGEGDGRSSDQDCGTTAKHLPLNAKKNLVLPQVRYHPTVQSPQDRTRTAPEGLPPKGKRQNIRSRVVDGQESDGTVCEEDSIEKNPNGTRLETHSRSAVLNGPDPRPDFDGPKCGTVPKRTRPKRNNAASRVGDGQESKGTDHEEAPKAATPTGTRLETPNSRSAVFVTPDSDGAAKDLPQKRTRQKGSNERSKVCDGQESSGTDKSPEGLDGLSLDPLVLGVGSMLDQGLVEKVEVLTRGQSSNPEWFTARKNRITASVAHSVAHCRFVQNKSTVPPASYLKAITGEGPRVQTRAMSWGIANERKAVQEYQRLKSAAMGRPVSVLDCGLFVDRSNPWLAASPDGVVTDGTTGQWLRSLEVKCPFKHRNCSVKEACEDPGFCLEILHQQEADGSPVFGLKRSHQYFTQVQCQMAVTSLKKSDFVVFTKRDLAVVQVDFDPEFWEETISRLKKFYFEALVPFVRKKSPQWNHEV